MKENSNGEWNHIGETQTKNEEKQECDTNHKRKIIGIYGLRCKENGKWYIGQSSDIHKRFGDYKGLRCKNQRKLYFALSKYGYDNFEKSILEKLDEPNWVMDYREMYWIKHLHGVSNGYNITDGGKVGIGFHGKKHTEETRKKMSTWQIGKKYSDETIQNISKSLTGIKWSDERRESIMNGKRNMSDDKKALWKSRIGLYQKGRKKHPLSEETKQKLREYATGKNLGDKNPVFGKKLINNGVISKFVNKDCVLEHGWKYGSVKKIN